MLGPHLTEANHVEVLARAKHRTKKEVAQLVRLLDPLPEVPPRIEPLGPARGQPLGTPTHRQFAGALEGPIRELPAGDRPRDWVGGRDGDDSDCVTCVRTELALAEVPSAALAPCETVSEVRSADVAGTDVLIPGLGERGTGLAQSEEPSDPSSARDRGLPLARLRYKVQFTAGQEYVELLEQATDLLGPAVAKSDLEEVHLRALRLLVAALKKQKYAITEKPRSTEPALARVDADQELSGAPISETPAHREEVSAELPYPRQRGRTIPAAVRRAVAERDAQRCTYVDERGQRCRETRGLELHHEQAFALGGPATASNIRLRCRAHNQLAAEEDFGREFMERKKAREPTLADEATLAREF
jgi:hypothetical protein